MKKLTSVLPPGHILLSRLQNAGFSTLNQCARAGDRKLKIKVRCIGDPALRILHLLCARNGIRWKKDPSQQKKIDKQVRKLVRNHRLSEYRARQIGEICFLEGWRPVHSKRYLKGIL